MDFEIDGFVGACRTDKDFLHQFPDDLVRLLPMVFGGSGQGGAQVLYLPAVAINRLRVKFDNGCRLKVGQLGL
jgi:hypothetical protein